MHKFLRSIGFSSIRKRTQMTDIIYDVVKNCDESRIVEDHEDGPFAEFSKNYAEDCGITVCGQFDEDNKFHPDYWYPFFRGTGITSDEDIIIERHADKESFAGACDDLRVGVTLIFYLQNAAEYMIRDSKNEVSNHKKTVTLSALASEGKILFPIMKDKEAVLVEKEIARNRVNLMAAARDGDEEAMESLTIDDMDTYSMISQRIVTDDVFTIVDSYFMPYGMECDQYSIMGEIMDISITKNSVTEEEVYLLTLETNDVQFDVCINKEDLLGEPAVGRRFKGVVWLQGSLQFS